MGTGKMADVPMVGTVASVDLICGEILMKNFLKWTKKVIYNLSRQDGIAISLYILMIIVLIICKTFRNNKLEILDWTVFFAMASVACVQGIAELIQQFLMNRVEDSVKLEENYERLCKMYPEISYEDGRVANALVVYNNPKGKNLDYINRKRKKDYSEHRFPVLQEAMFQNFKLIIDDSKEQYELPERIREHYSELFQAHDTSNIYNQLNIKVKAWEMTRTGFCIHTMRTTYFDSLVTNRVMDYAWQPEQTLRNIYMYGPYIRPLSESVFSNHLGFNGFIISSDGMIPLVRRNNIVSIGKRTYGTSIGASMKAKMALDSELKFTQEGLKNSILGEIEDELKINRNDMIFSIEDNIIAAYRDMVEGGKPQLLFVARTIRSKKEIETNFIAEKKKKIKQLRKNHWDKELKELEDGNKLLWIPVQCLKELVILSDAIVYEEKEYRMMPSASASIAMMINRINIFLKTDKL